MTFQEYIRRLILIKNFFGRGGQERERGEGEKEKLRGEMNGVLLVKKRKKKKNGVQTGWWSATWGGGTVSKRRERKISGNACRRGKIVRWHLISPRILRANEINYREASRRPSVSRGRNARNRRILKKRERERKRERKIWR